MAALFTRQVDYDKNQKRKECRNVFGLIFMASSLVIVPGLVFTARIVRKPWHWFVVAILLIYLCVGVELSFKVENSFFNHFTILALAEIYGSAHFINKYKERKTIASASQ